VTRGFCRLVGLAAGLTLAAGNVQAAANQSGDIRDFTVGLKVSELPEEGYENFTCVDEAGNPVGEIGGWSDYRDCPPVGAKGLREVRFEYDDEGVRYEDLEGTAIAGHPVLISLAFNDDGLVEGIRVRTDPEAVMYHRRKAYMLRVAILARYGQQGWDCEALPLGPGESQVGTFHIKEICTREEDGRRLEMETHMHRVADSPPDDILRSTRFEIWRADTETHTG